MKLGIDVVFFLYFDCFILVLFYDDILIVLNMDYSNVSWSVGYEIEIWVLFGGLL